MQILQPPGWSKPKGYSNGLVAKGTIVFVAGQVGWNAQEKFETTDFVEQAKQALRNVLAILKEAGAGPEHIARMTWYVLDMEEFNDSLKGIGAAWYELVGSHKPVMTSMQVVRLAPMGAKLEIEVTAVLPD